MKLFLPALICFCMAAFSLPAQKSQTYFLSNPCITPDGQTIVFSFEGDLWKVGIKDGQAVRLTAMQGYETNSKISPDGKWVAFTGRQFGNADVFVMPLNGGDIRQVTWHSGNDEVSSWSWDGQFIYFNSNRFGTPAGFKVNAAGGTPQRIFGNNYFQYDHNLIEHPISGEIYFNDTWESSNQAQRKRYKGSFNPDIQSYHPTTKKYTRYTSWEGKDFGATIDKQGNVYFISDEANNEYNLYSLFNGRKTALTVFNTSIKSPVVSANGERIVFEKDYQLWLYEVASGKTTKLAINIIRNSILAKEKDFEVKGNISAFDVSPDGKKIALVSRGELFVTDIEGKFIQIIDRRSSERVKEVKWLGDNKTLLFSQTWGGYLNFYTIAADGSSTLLQITADHKNNRSLEMNKKRTKALYLSGRDEVRIFDTKTKESKTIVKDEIWGAQTSTPRFSPDGDYVVFTAFRNFEQDIFVYHIRENRTINLTQTGVTESNPIWSADGNYIYFSSQRLKPAYPFGMPDSKVYRMPLTKLDDPFRMDKYNDLFKEEKKDTLKKKDSSQVKTTPVVINTDRIMERLEQVGPSFGRQDLSWIYQKGEKSSVLYTSNHGEGRNALWKTVIEPFEQNKTEKITGTDGSEGFGIVEVSDKLFVLSGGTISKLNLESNKTDSILISYTFRRNLSAEFDQMFDEAWAQMEQNYYDEKFHGIDWAKTAERYRKFLPYLNNRADLRVLLNDMLGELNSSHQGFNTSGQDESILLNSRTLETGIIFREQEPFTVKRIVYRSTTDKKNIDIEPGDILIKVNDEVVQPGTDRNYYFTKPSMDKELKLTMNRSGKNYEVKIHPQLSIGANLYDEWIDQNQQQVNQKSNGKIAYGYMKNMGQAELDQFVIDMTQELSNKDALIFDLRYNTGGNVHDEVLNFLSQRSYLKWKFREGELTQQPNFSPSDKPIVLLINEQSLSDAEMTAAGFKALKLGKIIGNETYRWIIFTSGISLVDNSTVRMPSWGCYTLDGKDLEKTGVQPDITVINTFEDKLNGNDPQLDRAIEEILKQLKK